MSLFKLLKGSFRIARYDLIERFFNKLNRIATRYDKLGSTFMALIKLASIEYGYALMKLLPGTQILLHIITISKIQLSIESYPQKERQYKY